MNWQVSFIIKGLIVPKEGITYGDVIIRRCSENVDESQFIMKVTEEEVKDNSAIFAKFEKEIANMLQLYALETGNFATLPSSYVACPISNEIPFGEIPPKQFTIEEVRIEADSSRIMRESSSVLRYILRAYEYLRSTFENSSKAFLRHGLKYYYMALGEHDIQRKIIDLFIALEALFSTGEEVRFRTSLRIASLLGFLDLDKKEVFNVVYRLYNKRSKIVHGVESVDLSFDEVNKLRRYLCNCFRIFLYLDKGKDEIINMLDACLIDDETSLELKEIIASAYKKWKEERTKHE